MFLDKILIFLKEFAFLFTELSLLFLFVNMLVEIINKKYSIFFQNHLKKDSFSSYIKAIFLGSLTPFCTCSSIPLLNAFLRANIPLGVCISFLITSPLINPIIIVMFVISFGIKITLFYLVFLFCIVLVISFFISKINSNIFFNKDFLKDNIEIKCCDDTKNAIILKNNVNKNKKFVFHAKKNNKFKKIFLKSFQEYKKILPYVIIGVCIGVLSKIFIPQNFFYEYLNGYGILAIILASLFGVFLYASCTSLIPIALALAQVGIPLSIVMSFLISAAGCSLPELILLKRMFKFGFLLIFALSIVLISIIFGILLFFIGI